jgi:hypothetical protein
MLPLAASVVAFPVPQAPLAPSEDQCLPSAPVPVPPAAASSMLLAVCGAFESRIGLASLALPSRRPPPPSVPAPTSPSSYASSPAPPVIYSPNPVSLLDPAPLTDDSPLSQVLELPAKKQPEPAASIRARVVAPPRGKVVDKPLTFRSNIKSSGSVAHLSLSLFLSSICSPFFLHPC